MYDTPVLSHPAAFYTPATNQVCVVGTFRPLVHVGRVVGDIESNYQAMLWPGAGGDPPGQASYQGVVLDAQDPAEVDFWLITDTGDTMTPMHRIRVFWDTASLHITGTPDFIPDGFINGDDADAFALAWQLGDQAADYNGDGFVNADDRDRFEDDFAGGRP
jgi:hypothetical protein